MAAASGKEKKRYILEIIEYWSQLPDRTRKYDFELQPPQSGDAQSRRNHVSAHGRLEAPAGTLHTAHGLRCDREHRFGAGPVPMAHRSPVGPGARDLFEAGAEDPAEQLRRSRDPDPPGRRVAAGAGGDARRRTGQPAPLQCGHAG